MRPYSKARAAVMARRRLATGKSGANVDAIPDSQLGTGLNVAHVEGRNEGTGPGKRRMGHLAIAGQFYDPRHAIGKAIRDALSAPPPGKVRTLADMTPEERAEMERLYGRKP